MPFSSPHLPPSFLKTHCTSIPKCKEAHAYLLRNAVLSNPLYASKLLTFLSLSPSGDLPYATKLFCHLPSFPDSFLFNTLIRAHSRGPHPSTSLSLFRHMAAHSSVPPDHFTYPFALAACARLRDPQNGAALHCQTVKLGLGSDVYVLNSLIQVYGACGWFANARKLFDGNPLRDVVSWNAMIGGYASKGFLQEGFECFEEMMGAENVKPDGVTMLSLVSGCSKLGDWERGRKLHFYAEEKGFLSGNLWLGNAVLDMYCKCGDMLSARKLFEGMGARDVFTWTSMISGLANVGSFKEALEFFGRMQQERIRPDEVVVVAVVSVCAQMGALDQGKYVHLLLERFNVKRDVVVETALVDMYAKCGCLDLATQVFEGMKVRNVFAWNAMIGGLAIHGHGRRALELFTRMENERMVPDDVTFIGLLSACCHAGLVEEGQKFFSLMKGVYKIEPRLEHYGCAVDLLCRAGLVQDALNFVERMPIGPNVVMWASLIRACKVHGELKLAERVGKCLVESEPDSCDRYVMLANLYAGDRRWDDALEIRNQMRVRDVEKVPGMSWIELNGMVHQFVAGDRSHSQTEKIYMMVEEMCLRVRSAGHVSVTSEVLFNIEEEEKEHSLFLHSEKLAVAFGLISTAPGSSIRITKNLRVCNDCHSFLKIVSKVFSREIVARDRSRFHHFKEGLCSCKDFW